MPVASFYSADIYPGTGSQVAFPVTFDFLDRDTVVVYRIENVDGSQTELTVIQTGTPTGDEFIWDNDQLVTVGTAPTTDQRLKVQRRTPVNKQAVQWRDGSYIIAEDLNTSEEQSLYIDQELTDWLNEITGGGSGPGDFVDLDNLGDVTITSPVDWDQLTFDATTQQWVNKTPTEITEATVGVDDLKDVDLTSSANWDQLTFDEASQQWVNKTPAEITETSVDLDDLHDATITNPEDKDVLRYNDTTDQWENTPSRTIADQQAQTPQWDDNAQATAGAIAERHDNFVSPTLPGSSVNQPGRFWFQNDQTKTLWVWDGNNWVSLVSDTITPTIYPKIIYVDATNGEDFNDGHQLIKPKKTIKAAVEQANADTVYGDGSIIVCSAGVYEEELPITITAQNLSIVGQSIRSVFVHPTSATELETMFLCDSGTYINGFTFAGLKAAGARGGAGSVDPDPTYGLPGQQGWVAAFRPNSFIRKSPYIQNCTNFADHDIDNDNFDPNNISGGDTTSQPTGGGILIDGRTPAANSPLRSFVVDAFTQITLDGPGVLATGNGYAQLVSFFGTFCHYHAKALGGAQLNLSNCTTDFGRYGLIADGKSDVPVFTGAVKTAAAAGSEFIEIHSFTLGTGWAPPRVMAPADHMVVEINNVLYPILKSDPIDPADLSQGYTVQIFTPGPGATGSTLSQVFQNQGLIEEAAPPLTVSFYLQSYISTGGHTFEFTGSGTDYRAHPDFGGVPNQANQVIEIGGELPAVAPNPSRQRYLNGGRVWQSSTDENGNFTVGETFSVNQKTGAIFILPDAVLQPGFEVREDIDMRGYKIYQNPATAGVNAPLQLQPAGDGDIILGTDEVDADGNRVNPAAIRAPVLEAQTDGRNYPVVTQEDLGYDPDEVPVAGLLGKLAFTDSAPAVTSTQNPPQSNELTFSVSGTTLTISYQPTNGGAVQTTTLTLA